MVLTGLPLVVPEAARDANGLAGDVRCLVGAEKRDRIREIPALTLS
jgi:hypothetical protein